MTAQQRQKYLLIGVGVIVGLFVINWTVDLLKHRSEVNAELATVRATQKDTAARLATAREIRRAAADVIHVGRIPHEAVRAARPTMPFKDIAVNASQASKAQNEAAERLRSIMPLARSWQQLDALHADDAVAKNQVTAAMVRWADDARVELTDWRESLTTVDKIRGFHVIAVRATASGSTASLAQFIYQMERTPIPIRIVDMNLRPHREARDDLEMVISFETLADGTIAPPPQRGTILGGRS